MKRKTAEDRVPAPLAPEPLREAMQRGSVVPFIGAGISMGAKIPSGRMPSYKELLAGLLDLAKDSPAMAKEVQIECKALIDKNQLMSAADKFDELLNSNERFLYIRRLLNHLQPKPSLTHEMLNLLDFPMIMTSNYDRLLETSLYPTPEVVTYRDTISTAVLEREGKPFIFKIHGDLTKPETIILGWRQYKKLHGISESAKEETDVQLSTEERDISKALSGFIASVLRNKTLLFLGCSFSGGEYREYFSDFARTNKIQSGPHFALVGRGIVPQEDKRRWYMDLGVNILEYEPDVEHSQVWEFLAALKPQRTNPPQAGKAWENFYILSERPDYLKMQLSRESQNVRSCRYLTPSLTNALATVDYIDQYCHSSLERFQSFLSDFKDFKEETLAIMHRRAKNLEELIRSGKIDVEVVFLAESLDQELEKLGAIAIERFRHVIELAEKFPHSLRIRAYPEEMPRDIFMKSSYALVFGGNDAEDIACFYAPQATTNKFTAHIVQINTQPVTERVEHFERVWVASLREAATLSLITLKIEEYLR